MLKQSLYCVGLVGLVIICLAEAQRAGKGGSWKNKAKKGVEKDVKELKEDLKKVKQLIASLDKPPVEGTCSSNKVHFFFHDHEDGHHDDHPEHGPDDLHVHVDLHMKGPQFGIGPAGELHDHEHHAVCAFEHGYAYISQNTRDHFAKFKFSFSKLEVTRMAVHVHQKGDLRNGCGKDLGSHYDPIDDSRDVGDLGFIDQGNIDAVWFNDTKLSIIGPHTILGRSIVGHDGSNNRVLCCVIGRAAEDHEHDEQHHDHDHHKHKGHDHAKHDHGRNHKHHGHDHDH